MLFFSVCKKNKLVFFLISLEFIYIVQLKKQREITKVKNLLQRTKLINNTVNN